MLKCFSPRPAAVVRGLCLLVLILAWPAAALAGKVTTVDGVTHVHNPAQPAEGVVTLTLDEQWRVGGENDEDLLFGVINRVLVDDEGNIFLLDQQLSEVKVISPAGELTQTLGREGDGPGEFRSPTDMAFMPDGTLGVVQVFPGKVVKLDLQGNPAGTWEPHKETTGGFLALVNLRPSAGQLVAGGIDITVDQAAGEVRRHSYVSRFDDAGQRLNEYLSKDVTLKFTDFKFDEVELMDFVWRRMDVARDGRVVAAVPRYGYEVSVFAPDGTLERVIHREYESWPRNERARNIWQQILEATAAQQAPPGTPIHVEDREPDVEWLWVTNDGEIWVQTSRAMWEPEEGTFSSYDVFSPDGHFQRQVRVVCDGNSQEDLLFFAGRDLLFQVTGFWDAALSGLGASMDTGEGEAKPMTVICYRIQ